MSEQRWHGKASSYNAGCRCDECREAARVAHKAWRAQVRERFAAGDIQVRHGEAASYRMYGCRCEPCTEANTEAGKRTRSGSVA